MQKIKKSNTKICKLCGRPENRVDKLFELNVPDYICDTCLQRSIRKIADSGTDVMGMLMYGIQPEIFDSEGVRDNDNNDPFEADFLEDIMKKNEYIERIPKIAEAESQPHSSVQSMGTLTACEIKKKLDEYIIGQDDAKKKLAIAVTNHYKKLRIAEANPDMTMDKSNILLIGPTGSGKTHLVKTLAKILNVPVAIADATTLTKTGYRGADVESVLSPLIQQAPSGGMYSMGIVFIDEIDKISKCADDGYSTANEAVQQGLLKLLEGNVVDVPVVGKERNTGIPTREFDTSNVLFICGGAFPGIEDIISKRTKIKSTIGFHTGMGNTHDNHSEILSKVTAEDITKFGFLPEFVGRLPVITQMEELDEETLAMILTEPKDAILKQYQALFAEDDIALKFSNDSIKEIAKRAKSLKTGARALRSIVEEFMLDVSYEASMLTNIKSIDIVKETLDTKQPIIRYKQRRKTANSQSLLRTN